MRAIVRLLTAILVLFIALPSAAAQDPTADDAEPPPAVDENEPDIEVEVQPWEELTVAAVLAPPMVVQEGNNVTGLAVDMWEAIATELDVDWEIELSDDYGAMLDRVENGSADLAIVPTAPNEALEARLDFSTPVLTSGSQIAVVKPDARAPTLVRAFFSATVLQVALISFLVVLVVAHLMWLAERGDDGDIRAAYLPGIWDAFWWAVVTITTVGYGDKAPARPWGKVLAIIWMIVSLFVLSIFIAEVSNVLGEEVEEQTVSQPSELLEVPVGAIAETSHAVWLTDRLADTTEVQSSDELFDLVANGGVEAILTDPYTLAVEEADGGREIIRTGELFNIRGESFVLAEESDLTEAIDQAIHRTRESGAFGPIIDRWVGG